MEIDSAEAQFCLTINNRDSFETKLICEEGRNLEGVCWVDFELGAALIFFYRYDVDNNYSKMYSISAYEHFLNQLGIRHIRYKHCEFSDLINLVSNEYTCDEEEEQAKEFNKLYRKRLKEEKKC